MKKNIISIVAACVFAIVCAASLQAQVKITTKKMRMSDFTSKTIKVVLTGSELYDEALKNEVSRIWRISPYEFCTFDEFQKLKTSQDYYFLAIMDSKMKKESEAGVTVMTVFRGGVDDAENVEKRPLEVVALPFSSAENPSGREFLFMPVMLDIIQIYIDESMTSDRVSYAGINYYSKNYLKAGKKTIYVASEDLNPDLAIDPEWEEKRMIVKDTDDVDQMLSEGTKDVLVSYTVAPSDPQKGSFCYKYLISPDTHELYYFSKHQISGLNAPGFLDRDMKLIAISRKK